MLETAPAEIEKFTAALFRHAGTEGFVSLRAFYEDDAAKPFRITPISMKGGLPFLIESADDDANRAANHPRKIVFCPPIAVFGTRETAREIDILAGLALSVECDQRPLEARATLEEILGPATLIVRSGGVWTDPASGQVYDKLHLHWRLRIPARGTDLATLKLARDLAARLVGGDPSNKPVCHPIRWPGSWHRKAEPRLCEIETATEHEIDLATALAMLEKAAPPTAASGNGKANGHGDTFGQDAAADWAEMVSGIVNGADYHNATIRLAGKMVASGMTDGAAVNMLRGMFESSTAPRDTRWQARYDDIPRAVSTARDKFGSPHPAQSANLTPPVIQIKNGKLSSLATRAEQVLITAGVPIYQRGGTLVRPIIETVDATRGRKTKVAQLKTLDRVYARDLLGRHAVWEKWDARAKANIPINPPEEIPATMLARAGDWTFPAIAGVISAPTMRSDGSLLLNAGYDQATRLLLVEPPAMSAIPDQPTRKQAEDALKLLEDLLTGFPFVDDVAKAVALSALITPVARGAFPVAPLHASRAPAAGSGKSFLWDIVAAIQIGQPMPVMSTGASEEETEKRLGAALLAGQPLISIDNISGELGGDALCQIIERPVVDIRVLGRSERVRIEAGGTSLFATGNNFVIVGDVCRRVITVSLDPATERPELRQFDFDPVDRVMTDRGKYIAAALTICRAYLIAGRPEKAPRLASFEGWSDTVRSALIWLGKEDAVKSMESARAEDPERVELGDMLEAWAAVIGTGSDTRLRLTVALSKGLGVTREQAGAELVPTYPEFYAALQTMALRSAGRTGRSAPPDARMFGKWLQRFRGRIVNGKRFTYLPDGKHGSEWWVEKV